MQINELIAKFNINKFTEIVIERKRVLLIILFIGIVFTAYTIYGKYQEANPNTLYNIVQAQVRDISKSISVNGEIKSDSEIELGSEASGQLAALYVKIGQEVKNGDIVARIENSTQRAQVTQALGALRAAEAQLASSEAQLQKVINGATLEDKSIVSSQVSAARSSLVSAQDTARNVLQTVYAGTVSAILFGTDVTLNDADSVNPKLKFQTTAYSAKLSVENNRVAIDQIIDRHKNQSTYNIDDEALDLELQKVIEELVSMRELTDNLLLALSGAITSASTPVSTINSYTTTVNAARSQILSNITALTSARYTIISAEKALQTSQGNESKVLSGARVEDIDVAEAGVQASEAAVLSAQGSYQVSKAALDKTYLYSPLSGVVVDIYTDVGEFISNSTPIIKISSKDMYVSALVSEVDIAKVSAGMTTQITLDALPNKIFTGVVDFIYPDKVEVLGIIYYEVRIDATEMQNSNLTILPGMSLDVTIPYEVKEGVLSIDRSATKKDIDKYFVQILNPNKNKPIDEKFSKMYFESGFIGDKYIEVLSGITPDTEIINFSKSGLSDRAPKE